jgi:hypothetical protein
MRSAFDNFINHHIQYQPYLDQINRICYPLGQSKYIQPKIGWTKANKVRNKYYYDEILFYLHLYVAQVCTKSIKKYNNDTIINASECIDNFASNSNKTSTLMTVFSSHLKEFLRPQKSCEVCSKECNAACTRCWAAFYCSDKCQKSDWGKHKKTCVPAKRGNVNRRLMIDPDNLESHNDNNNIDNNDNNDNTPTDVEVATDVEIATDVDLL